MRNADGQDYKLQLPSVRASSSHATENVSSRCLAKYQCNEGRNDTTHSTGIKGSDQNVDCMPTSAFGFIWN